MNCHQRHQRKDNRHDEISKDTNAYRGGDGYWCSGPVLEWTNHLDDRFWASDRGSGHYRPATDAYELRWSRKAHGQTVRSWRILLLEVAMCSRVLRLWAKSSLDICHEQTRSLKHHYKFCILSLGKRKLI
jgi:hypothetical protein